MKTFNQFLNEGSKFKTPSFFKDVNGNIAHLSGRTKTGKFSMRTKEKRMEFEDDDILEKFLKNNQFKEFKPNAKDFSKMNKGKF